MIKRSIPLRLILVKLLALIPLVFFNTLHAHEVVPGKIMASFGPYFYQTDLETKNKSLDSPLLGGFGLLAEGDIHENGGIELGLFYIHKLYFREFDDQAVAEKIKRLKITTGYRYWFNSRFSFAGAFSSAYSTGDPVIIHSDFTPRDLKKTTARETVEYGIDLSFQWEFLRNNNHAWLMDLRYFDSISAESNEDADSFGLMIAYKKEIPRN